MAQRWGTTVLIATLLTPWTSHAARSGARDEHTLARLVIARPPPPATTGLPAGVVVRAAHATSFRWSDGDWIARVDLTLTNATSTVQTVARTSFAGASGGTPMSLWADSGTMPESVTLGPGQALTYSVGWYYDGSQPRPASVTVSAPGAAGTFQQTLRTRPGHDLAAGPRSGASASAPTALPPGVQVRVLAAESFRWSDHDWIARVDVEIAASRGSAVVDPAMFSARANGIAMTRWSPAATIQSPVTVHAGGTRARGTLAWYYSGALARPAQVTVYSGSEASPSYHVNVAAPPGQDMVSSVPAGPVTPTLALPPGVRVQVTSPAVVFRWSDGDWVVRADVMASNGGNAPVTLEPAHFSAESAGAGMHPWSPAATLQGPFVVAPGQSSGGALAWYISGASPQPTSVTVRAGQFSQTVQVVPGPNPNP